MRIAAFSSDGVETVGFEAEACTLRSYQIGYFEPLEFFRRDRNHWLPGPRQRIIGRHGSLRGEDHRLGPNGALGPRNRVEATGGRQTTFHS